MVVASAGLAGVTYGVWYVLDEALGASFGEQLLAVSAGLVAGALAYLISSRLLGIREIEPLLTLLRRLRRR
jgi:hypothetical protein